MANIGNLVDRTFREYLEPMDDLVSFNTLSTGVNNSVQSILISGKELEISSPDLERIVVLPSLVTNCTLMPSHLYSK